MAKILGIDFKRDMDAIAMGAVVAVALSVLPIPGDPMGKLIAGLRKMIGGA